MGLSENVTALATRVATEFKSVRAAMMTLATAQTVTGVKQFAPGALLMRNAAGTLTAEPYSDINAPQSLERTLWAGPAAGDTPVAGKSWEWSPDGKSLWIEAPDGTVTKIGPAAASSGGGVAVMEVAADRLFSTVTLADIVDWIVPLPANEVTTIDAILIFSSAATTTGFQFAATPRTVGGGAAIVPSRFVVTFEYQTSATVWATFTQTVPTTPMAVTNASYVANQGMVCRITGQIEMGATAGELRMQARSEIAGSAITVRRGSPLRQM